MQAQMQSHAITDAVYLEFFENLLKGDRQNCARIVSGLLDAGCDVGDLYMGLLQRAMYEVGRLWETNKISVAVEHLATSITESLLTLVYPRIFAAEHNGKRAVVSCVANEYHQLGGKMVADILELNGWDAYFLGANTPEADLYRMVEEKQPDMLCLSLALFANFPSLLSLLERVTARFPGLPVLVGGQAFQWGGKDISQRFPNVTYVPSLHALRGELDRLEAA